MRDLYEPNFQIVKAKSKQALTDFGVFGALTHLESRHPELTPAHQLELKRQIWALDR